MNNRYSGSQPASEYTREARVKIRSYRDGDRDPVVALWRTVFPDAPARNDPVLDIERKRLPPGRVPAV